LAVNVANTELEPLVDVDTPDVPPPPTVIVYVVPVLKFVTVPVKNPPAPPPPPPAAAPPPPPPATTKYSTVSGGGVVCSAKVPVPAVNLVCLNPFPWLTVSAVRPVPILAKYVSG
jgi:hypothetical protein